MLLKNRKKSGELDKERSKERLVNADSGIVQARLISKSTLVNLLSQWIVRLGY